MGAVKGKVKEANREFSYQEISSGTQRAIQITEEGTKEKDAAKTYYLYHVGQDKKPHNLHEMADYNKNQADVYKKLAEGLAKKWVTQGKWPADGWEFTYSGNQIKLYLNKK